MAEEQQQHLPTTEETEQVIEKYTHAVPLPDSLTSNAGFPLNSPPSTTEKSEKTEEDEDEDEDEDGKEEEEENDEETAREHFAVGKSLLEAGQYSEASDALSEALTIMCELYGELGNETVEYYYYYGRALTLCANAAANNEDALSDFIKGAVSKDKENNLMANSTKSESSSKEPDEDEDEDDENASNKAKESYEVAWQCLETARIILRQNDPNSLRLSDICVTLGEFNIDLDNVDQAIADYTAALEIRQKQLPDHDRRLSEVYYGLGLAYLQKDSFPEAVKNLTIAADILQKRIDLIRALNPTAEQVTDKTPYDQNNSDVNPNELVELLAIYDELKAKIHDAEQLVAQQNGAVPKEPVVSSSSEKTVSSPPPENRKRVAPELIKGPGAAPSSSFSSSSSSSSNEPNTKRYRVDI